MKKLHAKNRSRADLRIIKIHSSFVFTLFFIFSGLTAFGQTETRTTLNTTNVVSTTDKSKIEYLKSEHPELYGTYYKLVNLDNEIRNFSAQHQLPASIIDQYALKISSICADCVKNGLLDHNAVYTHINNPSISGSLLEFMEEFLTNLSNQ
jgi:hypothetical protein